MIGGGGRRALQIKAERGHALLILLLILQHLLCSSSHSNHQWIYNGLARLAHYGAIFILGGRRAWSFNYQIDNVSLRLHYKHSLDYVGRGRWQASNYLLHSARCARYRDHLSLYYGLSSLLTVGCLVGGLDLRRQLGQLVHARRTWLHLSL